MRENIGISLPSKVAFVAFLVFLLKLVGCSGGAA